MKTTFLLVAIVIAQSNLFAQENEIPEAGNVGIGTTQPTEKLDVRGGAKIDSTLRVGDSILINNSARVGEDLRVNGNAYIEGSLTLPLLVNPVPANPEVLFIDPSGELKRGGGDVKSLAYEPFPQLMPCLTDGNGNTIYASPTWQHGPEKIFVLNNQCIPDVKLGVGVIPTAKVHIQTTPNFNTTPIIVEKVVNGSTTPYKLMQLDNTGLLYAREVKVNLDSFWPDYVFEENYDLLSLEEVKSFVDQNGHLPNVPSAQEMEENGVNVSETSVMLMEKVEELTLYLIQLQEQLKQQQEMLLLQQELIKKLEEQQK